jgi:hypothetical protein
MGSLPCVTHERRRRRSRAPLRCAGYVHNNALEGAQDVLSNRRGKKAKVLREATKRSFKVR